MVSGQDENPDCNHLVYTVNPGSLPFNDLLHHSGTQVCKIMKYDQKLSFSVQIDQNGSYLSEAIKLQVLKR